MKNDKNKNLLLILPIIVLLILCISIVFFKNITSSTNKELVIIVDGKEYTFENGEKPNLDQNTMFTISNEYGYNTIEIYNHEICVTDSDCNDEICIKTGKINFQSDNDMIVCAPHRLCIYIRN